VQIKLIPIPVLTVMQRTWNHIWVVGSKDCNGRFRGMNKVAGEKFFCSAKDAFDHLGNMSSDVAKCFGVFEIPCLVVFELATPEEEGKSIP